MGLQVQGDPFMGLGTASLLEKRVNFVPSVWVPVEAILRNVVKCFLMLGNDRDCRRLAREGAQRSQTIVFPC